MVEGSASVLDSAGICEFRSLTPDTILLIILPMAMYRGPKNLL